MTTGAASSVVKSSTNSNRSTSTRLRRRGDAGATRSASARSRSFAASGAPPSSSSTAGTDGASRVSDSSAKRPIGVSRRRTASQSVGGGAASDAAHAPAAYLAAAVQGTRAAHITCCGPVR